MSELLARIEVIARKAGDAILEVYHSDTFDVEIKGDNSPLTRADKAASEVIENELRAVSDYPIVSEENTTRTIDDFPYFWLVDPLDGTKEFIKKNDEFTVNIALVSKSGEPVLGIVYAPVLDVVYSGDVKRGVAEKKTRTSTATIESNTSNDVPVIVTSRSHKDETTQLLLDSLDSYEETTMGSSLKLCLVAEGVADLYPRLAPTSLWDTAAADAVVTAAGGKVQDQSGAALRYIPKEASMLNPFFIVSAKNCTVPWREVLGNAD